MKDFMMVTRTTRNHRDESSVMTRHSFRPVSIMISSPGPGPLATVTGSGQGPGPGPSAAAAASIARCRTEACRPETASRADSESELTPARGVPGPGPT
jgi:hypothetical protein